MKSKFSWFVPEVSKSKMAMGQTKNEMPVEAKAEFKKIFPLFSGSNENKKICF